MHHNRQAFSNENSVRNSFQNRATAPITITSKTTVIPIKNHFIIFYYFHAVYHLYDS